MIREITIPGQPVGKGRPRFSRRSGIAYTPKKTTEYENYVKGIYLKEYGRTLIKDPVKLEIEAYFKVPKSDTKSVKRQKLSQQIKPTITPDADNICKCLMDSVNGIAYIDDKQVIQVNIEKLYAEEPKVILRIISE